MTSVSIFLISFVAIVIGLAAGMLLQKRISAAQLDASAKEVIRLGAGFWRRSRRC